MSAGVLRVLCLDIEGGHGGSSRSLYELVRHLDRDQVQVEVWCRRDGALHRRYAEIGVISKTYPDMPKTTSVKQWSRNILVYGRFFLADWPRAARFRQRILEESGRFDLIHCNHESLFWLARWLRPRVLVPVTLHVRTNLWASPFARWQTRMLSRHNDGLAFITRGEQDNFTALGGIARRGCVIHNPVTAPESVPPAHDAVPVDIRFNVACLSNFSWLRGTDRVVEIARALVAMGKRDRVRFVMAGDMHLPRSVPTALRAIARKGGTLEDYVVELGLQDMFLFLGHVSDPDQVLAACQVLIKPTRDGNPWGRDILESLVMEKPVLAVGRQSPFVLDGTTGVLQHEFDSSAMAETILTLQEQPQRLAQMGHNGRELVLESCDGTARAADLLAFWREALPTGEAL